MHKFKSWTQQKFARIQSHRIEVTAGDRNQEAQRTIPNYNTIHYFTDIKFYFTKRKKNETPTLCVNEDKMIADNSLL